MVNVQGGAVERLESSLGATWPHLRSAREAAAELKQRLARELTPLVPDDASLVVFGSLARDEVTVGSDVDWTLLVDGLANPEHHRAAQGIDDALNDMGLKEPGREGTFGGLAFSHELVHLIGGADDTNRNMTQRVLLLLESVAIGPNDAHRRVINNVLKRYVIEDYGWAHGTVSVPRFLLNDIARYWRTVAVDFAYKRRQRRGQGWALRTLKLRMSRKLTFAAGMLVCFNVVVTRSDDEEASELPKGSTHPLVDYLSGELRYTPLDIMASSLSSIHDFADGALAIVGSYDEFLGILDDEKLRTRLDELAPSASDADPTYKRGREIGHRFQDGLNELFLEAPTSPYPRLTRRYGVF